MKNNREISIALVALGLIIIVGVLSYQMGKKTSERVVKNDQQSQAADSNTKNNDEVPAVVPGTPAVSGENIPGYQNTGKYIGYIKSIATQNNGTTGLSIDYVQWLTCAGNSTDCTNGYKVVNSSPQMRFFPVASNATVTLQTYSHNPTDGNFYYNQPVSLATFKTAFNTPTTQYTASKLLYWITLNNGVVTNISEQYQP